MTEPTPATTLAAERTETLPVYRSALESTMAEDPTLINVREVLDWCSESRDYRPPLASSTTLLSLSLGLLVGFGPAYAATDVSSNGVWKGLFLFGALLGLAGCICALIAMAAGSARIRNKFHIDKRPTALERLADRMENACQKGLLRAAAAEDALREKVEKERGEGGGS
jgi:hypothetical protein